MSDGGQGDRVSIIVSELDGLALGAQPVEIVERKGIGHPDTVCDALAEEVSLALSRFYLERFGFVLHHNVDKVLLRGGSAQPAFAGGTVTEPIELYLAGRATHEYGGVRVPVEQIAIDACRSWLSTHLHALDAEHHVRVHCLIRPGSRDLVELFERQRRAGAPRLANDTSIGVGFAPLTPLEGAVLAAEASLYEREAPERGEDVKVMGVRVGDRSTLTVACAFIGSYLRHMDAYRAARSRAVQRVRAATAAPLGAEPAVEVNAADDPGGDSVYLTVTGTSAEAGDDGQTGRGNRVNGLIAPARPTTMESFAGKNPITHVGKLYNVAATRIADALVSGIDGATEAHVLLVSRIGTPIEEPQVVHVRLRADTPEAVAALAPRATAIAREHLESISALWERLLSHNLATDGLAGL
jgi:S-adenosylmethionine synthetase